MSKSRRRPQTPAEIVAELQKRREQAAVQRAAERAQQRDPTTWGADGASLKRQEDVTVVSGPKKGEVQTAKREDLFARLHRAGAVSSVAIMALRVMEADLETQAGRGGRGHSEKVDGGQGSRELVTIRSMEAGDRLQKVEARIGAAAFALLSELLLPQRVHTLVPNRWRLVVRLITGFRDDEAQRRAVVKACEGLGQMHAGVGRLSAA